MEIRTGGKILDILREGSRWLTSQGDEEPWLSSELLLSHALGLGRIDLFRNSMCRVEPNDLARFRELLLRRGSGEPIQYITEKTDWLDFELSLRRGVFIPRPETEILVGAAVEWFTTCRGSSPIVLDVGTGCGNVAIGLAKRLPDSLVCASDISLPALLLARENARRNGVLGRVSFFQGDLLGPLRRVGRVDLIAANPPYVRSSELKKLQTEVRRWEPRAALHGGDDGLNLVRRLIEDSPPILRKGGGLAIEIGAGQSEEVRELVSTAGSYSSFKLVNDLDGRERVAFMEL